MQDVTVAGFPVFVGRLPGDEARGRCVFAADAIEAGSVLLAEQAAAFVLRWDQWGSRCGACLSPAAEGRTLRACSGCGLERYCSQACQRKQWKAQHKLECARLPRLRAAGLEGIDFTDAALLLRVLGTPLRRLDHSKRNVVGNVTGGDEAEGDAEVVALQPSLDDVYDMVSPQLRAKTKVAPGTDPCEANDRGQCHARLARVARIVSAACGGKDRDQSQVDSEAALAMMLRFEPGTFHIHDADCVAFAYGLFPHVALTNHACAPNSVATFVLPAAGQPSAPTLKLRALEDISHGAEIVHCYVDLLAPVWSRQVRLQYGYEFWCECSRCCGPRERDVQLCGTPRGKRLLDVSTSSYFNSQRSNDGMEEFVPDVRDGYVRLDSLSYAPPEKQRCADLEAAAALEQKARSKPATSANRLWKECFALRSRHVHKYHLGLMETCKRGEEAAQIAGDWEFAVACLEHIVTTREAILPALHPQRYAALVRLGHAYRKAGKQVAAAEVLQKAVEVLEKLYNKEFARMPYCLNVRDLLLQATSRSGAKSDCKRSDANQVNVYGVEDPTESSRVNGASAGQVFKAGACAGVATYVLESPSCAEIDCFEETHPVCLGELD